MVYEMSIGIWVSVKVIEKNECHAAWELICCDNPLATVRILDKNVTKQTEIEVVDALELRLYWIVEFSRHEHETRNLEDFAA